MFAASDSFVVFGPADTTVFHWTPADEVEVMVFAVGTHPLTGGRTQSFVPASRPGWRLVYPDENGAALFEPSEPCSG
jgi:hypothetical protein